MQATSVRLYRRLVPGLTNVTNRLRYFSFYCWAIETYEKTVHADDLEKWSRFIRRAEAVYALACTYVDDANSDGMASALWARGLIGELGSGNIEIRHATDAPGAAGQYLAAKRGNFGQPILLHERLLERLRRGALAPKLKAYASAD